MSDLNVDFVDYQQNQPTKTKRDQWLIKNRIPLFAQQLLLKEKITVADEQLFNQLSSADPSQNNSAVQWICECYMRDGFRWEDINAGSASKVWDTLSAFNKYRKHLDTNARSVYNYQSLSDLYGSIDLYVKKEQSRIQGMIDVDLVGRELKRQQKAQAYQQTHPLIWEEDFKVVVPLTQFAAEWWGQGTQWCTAASKNNYFDHYNQRAPLIIVLFKEKDPLTNLSKIRKFQIWALESENELQFMDENDRTVDRGFVQNNWEIFKSVIGYFFEKSIWFIDYIPEHLKTFEMCEQTVKRTPWAISHIPEQFCSDSMIKTALESNVSILGSIAFDRLTDEIYQHALSISLNSVKYLPNHMITPEICERVIETCYYNFEYLPKKMITSALLKKLFERPGPVNIRLEEYKSILTQEICLLAVKKDPYLVSSIPEQMLVKETYEALLEKNNSFINLVPKDMLDEQMLARAIRSEHFNSTAMRDYFELLSSELCWECVQKDSNCFPHIPADKITLEMCVHFVKESIISHLTFVPIQFQTKEICELILSKPNNIAQIKSIPPAILTQEFCKKLIELNPYSIAYIPIDVLNKQMCVQAIQKNSNMIKYIHKILIDDDLCSLAVKKNGLTIEFIPALLITRDLCIQALNYTGLSLKYIPQNIIDQEICELAVLENVKAIEFVPQKFFTKEIAKYALESDIKFIKLIPEHLFDHEFKKFITDLINNNQNLLDLVHASNNEILADLDSLQSKNIINLFVESTHKHNGKIQFVWNNDILSTPITHPHPIRIGDWNVPKKPPAWTIDQVQIEFEYYRNFFDKKENSLELQNFKR